MGSPRVPLTVSRALYEACLEAMEDPGLMREYGEWRRAKLCATPPSPSSPPRSGGSASGSAGDSGR